MPDDAELLRRYAASRDETAFGELVRRHLDGVYSAALRRVGGDAHLAEDATQQVFAALARKAGALADHPFLGAWLYTTTRNEAANIVRRERRRKAREREAYAMGELLNTPPGPDVDWNQVAPVLDEMIDALPEQDRRAILLRFVERRAFAEIGAALRVSEDAARMRVDRALDKLHALLAKRGVTSTASALGVALANQAVAAVPPGLAASVMGAVLQGGVTTMGSGSLAACWHFMNASKITLPLVVAALCATGLAIYQSSHASSTASELAAAHAERAALAASLAEVQANIQREHHALQVRTAALESQRSAAARTAEDAAAAEAERALQAKALQQLLANDPQLLRIWRDSARQWWIYSRSPLFQRHRLTPGEIEQTLAELQRRADLKIGATTSGTGFPEALAADTRFMESQRHPAEAFLVENIVQYAAPEGVAFTPEQTEQLLKTFVALRPPSLATQDTSMPVLQANLDWAQVIAQARAYLEPAQINKLVNRAARMSRDKILKAAASAVP